MSGSEPHYKDSKELRRWKLAASYLHTELARQSNPDTFEMGMIVGLVIGQTHGKALMRGVGERLALAGTDVQKLAAVARRALAATAPIAPGESRYVPKGYRLLADGSLVPVEIVAEETLQAMIGADPTHQPGCMCEACYTTARVDYTQGIPLADVEASMELLRAADVTE